MDVFIWDNNVSVETNYNHWKHMNDKEHRDYDEEVYFETGMEDTVRQVARTKYVFNHMPKKRNQ